MTMKLILLIALLIFSSMANANGVLDELVVTHDGLDINNNPQAVAFFRLHISKTAGAPYESSVILPTPVVNQAGEFTWTDVVFPFADVNDGELLNFVVTAMDVVGNESVISNEKAFTAMFVQTDETPHTPPNLVRVVVDGERLDVNVDCPDGYVCTVTVTPVN